MFENFTPVSALIGGVMIGLAAVLLLAATGRIAGISGIVGGLVAAKPNDAGWRIAFVAGLLLAPLLYAGVSGRTIAIDIERSPVLLIAGGLLVGFGTLLGSGCTSGHGVCGLSRLSKRSFVAVAMFMVAALATVFILRHLVGGP